MRFLLISLLLLFNQALAQNYYLDHFTDENGLPQNSVKSITTDNAGFIWLATENGLVRYDGQKFVLFDKNHSKTASNRITNFRVDVKTNLLYALTEDWQLIQIKDGRVLPNPQPYHKVFKFKDGSRFDYNYANGTPNFLEKYVNDLPFLVVVDQTYTYSIKKGLIEFYKNDDLISQLPFDHQSQWRFFVLNKQLYYVDEQKKISVFHGAKPINVNLTGDLALFPDLKGSKLYWNTCTGNVFLTYKNALYSLVKNPKTGAVVSKRVIDNINLNDLGIFSIYLDQSNGDIYLGSFIKGLYIYRKKNFQALNPSALDLFYAQVPYNQRSILYANGHLFENGKAKTQFEFLKKNSSNYSMLIDHQKNIWAPYAQQLNKFSPDLKKIAANYTFPSQVNCIYQSPDRILWAGNQKGIYQMGQTDTGFTKIAALAHITEVSYLQKKGPILWIGTHKGMYYYDFSKRKQYQIPALAHKDIRSIYLRKNEVWITTYGDGLYLFRDGKIVKMPNDNNNFLNTSHCILEDKNGFFWISTNKGLFQVAIADLLAYADQKVSNVFYLYYNRTAGFNTNEFNGGCQPCGTILANGDFSFPNMNGAVLFNPLTIKANEPKLPIFIDKVMLDNETFETDGTTLTLPNEFNRLNISLATPYFGNGENLSFEYKLAEQKEWTSSIDHIITYSSLPSGYNTLNIRKASGFGPNNYTYKNILIIVPPHIYQTWWFMIGIFIFIAVLIYLYIKLRIKIIRRRNKQLEESIGERTNELQNTIQAYETSQKRLEQHSYFQRRLIAAIAHDIKSPLKYLMLTGELLYKSADKQQTDLEGLKAMYTSSSQIYHFTDNLLNYAKGFTNEDLNVKTSFNLSRLIDEKISIFKAIANSQGTTIHNLIPKDVYIETNEQLLSVILHNLLDNAVKFTTVGEISFYCNKEDDQMSITIKDTGIGMKPYQVLWCNRINNPQQASNLEDAPLNAGLGLIMVKELVRAIGGEVYVAATLGKGTVFEITI